MHLLRNKPLVIAVVIPLIALAGCAASPAQPGTAPAVPKTSKAEKPNDAKSSPEKDAQESASDIQQGDTAWRNQDLDRAVYFYVQALDKSPQDAVTMGKIGAIEDLRGNAPLAQKAFEMAHAVDPAEPHIAERLARLYLNSGNVDGAAELYTRVLATNPNRARALDGMGDVCVVRNDFGQAIGYFDRALKAEQPDQAAILTHRGFARMHTDDLSGAESDLRMALSIRPREDAWTSPPADSWRYLGDVQVLRGDSAAALDSLLHAMTTAEAFNEIGITLMSMKRYQDAHEYFTKAIGASPSWFEEAQRNLALVNERLRKSAG